MDSTHNLVDYFAVVGLNVEKGLEPAQQSSENLDSSPLERLYKSYVLSHLPQSVPAYPFDAEAVSMLCFPRGLSFRTDREEGKTKTHTFVITKEDGSRSYGSALTFYEEVASTEIMLAMQILQDMHMAEMSNTQSLTLKRHRERRRADEVHSRSRSSTLHRPTPNISHHSESLLNLRHRRPQPEYKHLRDTLHCSKCICFISRIPLIHTHLKLLSSLYEVMMDDEHEPKKHLRSAHKKLPIASYLFNYFYETPPLLPGSSIKVFTWKSSICCQRPGSSNFPLFDYPFRKLFCIFKFREIMPIFTSVLLEHQILIFSKDYSKLMLVAECISCLLFPFQWQHTYVPILPSSLMHFLDAPVPFIMGLCIAEGEGADNDEANGLFESFSRSNSCVVDIDRRRVGAPEDLPTFPYASLLQQDIEHEINRFKCLEKTLHHQRDSGFVRESYQGGEEKTDEADRGLNRSNNASSSSLSANIDWSVNDKLEMLQKNEALARVTALAERSGVKADLSCLKESLTEAALSKHKAGMGKVSSHLDEHTRDLLFNSSVREVFLHYFLQLFGSYESFVIHYTGESVQQWLITRETSQNFDKTAFLSDQSDETLPFLAPFIETQMFASFIDQKILDSLKGGHNCATLPSLDSSEPQPTRDMHNLRVFSSRLKQLQEELHHSSDHRPRRFYRTAAAKEAEAMIEKKFSMADQCGPLPHHINVTVIPSSSSSSHAKRSFPSLPSDCFKYALKEKRNLLPEWKQEYGLSLKNKSKGTFKQRDEYLEQAASNNNNTQPSDTNLKVMVSNNWKLMEALLKEVKTKTKRMLVQKMGKEAVELGHGEVTRVGIEENTLIASLCDLLERIWSYGFIKKQDKSSLWQHLNHYYEASSNHSNKENNNNEEEAPPDESQAATQDVTTATSSSNGNLTWPIRHHRRSNSRGLELPVLEALPCSLLFDLKNVVAMTEIKTSIGLARAFVRLSLEKKLLSKHLKELFSNQDLLRRLYKRYAFLRCEDERDQFLYHLLSLNAVDYYCFTNTFQTSTVTYRLLIYPRMKMGGGSTSANCWIRLSGQLGTTEEIPLPKHSLDLTTKHKNLGILTSMRIGHDNAGLSPKWMVENVIVRNQVTGHTYRFSCGRWLGKGIDDGALERLLVAELLAPSVDSNELMERCKTPPRCRSPSASGKHIEARVSDHEIRERLGDSVNSLVKHFCRTEKERESSTKLLCGEGGLVSSLELIFQYGFKSARLFRNRFFIWDFLEKVVACYDCILQNKEYCISDDIKTTMQSFCYVVGQINRKAQVIGKDERFQIFVCFGLRDRLLLRWLRLVSKSPVTVSMYEEHSFLRDHHKLKVVLDLLDSLKDFKVVLEASVVRGIKL